MKVVLILEKQKQTQRSRGLVVLILIHSGIGAWNAEAANYLEVCRLVPKQMLRLLLVVGCCRLFVKKKPISVTDFWLVWNAAAFSLPLLNTPTCHVPLQNLFLDLLQFPSLFPTVNYSFLPPTVKYLFGSHPVGHSSFFYFIFWLTTPGEGGNGGSIPSPLFYFWQNDWMEIKGVRGEFAIPSPGSTQHLP